MNNQSFKINDKIYCIENYDVAKNNTINIPNRKIEPNYINKFEKNKTYQIIDI